MCGRFGSFAPSETLAEAFGLAETPNLTPRYNITPGQAVALVRNGAEGDGRELVLLRWGLIPSWAKKPEPPAKMINARSESVLEKPAFRRAVRHRRGLIPADGFYEWTKGKKGKRPFFFRHREGRILALAGLWERWTGEDEEIESCTILTTTANDLVQSVHDRMPVIIKSDSYEAWLDNEGRAAEDLTSLFQPFPADQMEAVPVSAYVNSPAHEGPRCIKPASEGQMSLWS